MAPTYTHFIFFCGNNAMADSIFDNFNLSKAVTTFGTQTNTSMSKVKENVLNPMDVSGDKLKQGVALTKPNDTSVKGQLTAYTSSTISQLDGIIGALSGGYLNTKMIVKAVRIGPDGVDFDKEDLLGSVSSNMGYPINSQSAGMRKIANLVNSEFKRYTGISLPGLVTSDGKRFSVNANWRTLVGKETLRQINQFTGIDQFVDVSVQNAMYNAVMKMATEYGMKDSYKSLYDLYLSKRDANSIMIDAVRTMIARGDVESIDTVLGIVDQGTVNAINAAYPDFIETLFRSFKFASDVLPEDYDVLCNKLMTVVTRVAGPNWWERSTQFGTAYNLAIISSASSDIIKLLSKVEVLQPLIATAGMFREQGAAFTLKSSFPKAPVYL